MLLYPSELLSSLCQSFPVERKIFLCSSSSVLVVARTRAAAILKTSTTAAATVGTFAAGVGGVRLSTCSMPPPGRRRVRTTEKHVDGSSHCFHLFWAENMLLIVQ
jgi:hypothetical protein